jgi:hypothetical protein
MRICKHVLVSLMTFGCIVAQGQDLPQTTQPEKPTLDFTFPPFRPQSRHLPQNGLVRPIVNPASDAQNSQPRTCSVPLLEAQIPKDIHFFIKQIRPSKNQIASMPQAQTPAPSCAEKFGSESPR